MSMFKYEPSKDGAITAIRIYYMNDRTPMADLAFAFGGMATIEWTNVVQRESYKSGINGYTYVFDEREKSNFNSFVKQKSASIYTRMLWDEFGNVPMNPETEEIEEDWRDFPLGTHREEIWHWFEESFNISVAELMYQ